MSDKKLTPRVGDRVLVKFPRHTKSFIGDVLEQPYDDLYRINVDCRGVLYVDRDDLTVLDRDSVEWPEGWSDFNGDAFHTPSSVVVDKSDLAELLRTGPDMLARWDELMEGDA